MANRVDPFAALLEVLDKRAVRFGPDRTAMWGTYEYDADLATYVIILDTGQRVPDPVIMDGVYTGSRYPCIWMQGGHDILVLAL